MVLLNSVLPKRTLCDGNTPLCGVPAGRRRKGDDELLARLGANIERARKACGLTQERLAEKADLHPRVIQKIESGETNMKATTLMRIQSALGCSWAALVPTVRTGTRRA